MKKSIQPHDFRVPAGTKVKLKRWPTLVQPNYDSKKEYAKLLQKQVDELSTLQQLLYASDRYAVLLIFQAMDAAGKDGAIRHVMSGVNPQGCQVFSFKHPSATEYEACLSATSTEENPWYVVPADDKENARLIVAEIILDVFSQLKMAYPEPTAERRLELQQIRKSLAT